MAANASLYYMMKSVYILITLLPSSSIPMFKAIHVQMKLMVLINFLITNHTSINFDAMIDQRYVFLPHKHI